MVDGNSFNIPLSPPTSPRMNQFNTESSDSKWQDQQQQQQQQQQQPQQPQQQAQPSQQSQQQPQQQQQQQQQQPAETPDSNNGDMALVHSSMPGLDLDRKPTLRSHKTFPYTLRTSGSNIHGAPDTPPLNGSEESSGLEGLGIQGLAEPPSNEMATVSYGGSVPASPISNLTPNSPHKEGSQDQQDLNGLNIDMDGMDGMDDMDDEIDTSKPMTAAEIRAQKRKMKRFRLTHNQTRFLMSEFARQAHPDAAHRERLAREIPGLSPRQVQVWFQNRRAKLKRLTSDDRERMMRSRALPDDFDMTQALHSPFGASHGVGSAMNSPSSYSPSFPEGNMIRPLNLDNLRRGPDGHHMSPTGITPSFGNFNFTPPQSVTDTLSPVSPAGDGPFGNYSPTLDQSPRRSNPFAPSPTTTFTSHPQIPRLQLHDRSINRSRSESISSPLRTSMSYGGPENNHGLSTPPLGNDPQTQNGMLPYGLGYSNSYSSMPGFQATSNSRMRTFSGNNLPRRMELGNNQYRGAPPPQSSTFPNYTSSPMAAPSNFSMMSAPHHITSFPNSYMRQESSSEPFPSVDSLIGGDDHSSHHENESNENGMQPLTTF